MLYDTGIILGACKVRSILTLLNYTILRNIYGKTSQLACQAKGLCRALPVHACWCTSSCRVVAVQCQRGTCPCKVTAHHLTSPPPWYALPRGRHWGLISTTLHWGKLDTPNQLYSNILQLTHSIPPQYTHTYPTSGNTTPTTCNHVTSPTCDYRQPHQRSPKACTTLQF